MSAALYKLVSRYGYRLPELLARAVAGDPSAWAIFAAAGFLSVAEVAKWIKRQ